MNRLATDFLYDRWDLISENGYGSLLVLYSLSATTVTDARTYPTTHTYDSRASSRRSQVIGELPKSSAEIFKILQQTGGLTAVQLKNLIETIKSIGDVLKESALRTGTAEAAEPLILRPEGSGRK